MFRITSGEKADRNGLETYLNLIKQAIVVFSSLYNR